MANSTPAGIQIEYDDAGGAPQDITAHVITINDIDIESIVEEVRPLGQAWNQFLPIGVAKVAAIELGGLYDDTVSTGPDALFADRAPEGPSDDTRTLTITWLGSKTTAVETYLVSYTRSIDKNGLTKYKAKLQPTGAVTEA